ncbi:hypothetical protein Poli38472_006905 [Pythium oligandrum]|uniref:Uncharacterized protein n=1 Tax=Pythium oligandrum TaxID=41045 RepID=A0A8K1C9H8_PYTOL|nr:hypothetical protein Poli38472_006905 [Pythium oligandrum]|eukprot:TMW58760.1 hypothetical protein Poli38472_006905 [Pythium oligandrum]
MPSLANSLKRDAPVEIATQPEERCRYPSKYCSNARARKTNGGMHRFCEFHRRRANTNQKRWSRIRRLQATEEKTVSPKAVSLPVVRSPVSVEAPFAGTMAFAPVSFDPWHGSESEAQLDPQDIELLNALLFDDAAPSTSFTQLGEFEPVAFGQEGFQPQIIV